MKYKKNRAKRTGDIGTLEERKIYYESCPKCRYCNYKTNKSGKEIGKDGWKSGLSKAFKDKWKLLAHYNLEHPNQTDNIKYLFSDDEIVICPICNQFMGQLGHKHLAKHNISIEELKGKYPDIPMRPNIMKRVWSDRCKEFNKTNYMKEHVSLSLLKGHREGKYDEIKKISSDKKKKKFKSGELVVWNKGLTKYDHPSIMSTSDKFRDMWSKKILSHGNVKGYFYSEKNKCEIPYRSSYELKAFEILEEDNNVSKYEYEFLKIRYRGADKKVHTYYPDIITDDNRIIEIKADWVFNKDLKDDTVFRKIRAAKRWASKNGYTFEVWTEKELGLLES